MVDLDEFLVSLSVDSLELQEISNVKESIKMVAIILIIAISPLGRNGMEITMPFRLIQLKLICDNPIAENVIATCAIGAFTNCPT